MRLILYPPSPTWNHDYLVDEARIVAVLRSTSYIHELCNIHQMPFRFELLMAISTLPFSRAIQYPHLSSQSKSRARGSSVPGEPVYESGNFVIAPFVGHGELLTTKGWGGSALLAIKILN